MSVIPNLFLVGAAKSGTSSLYHYLRRHPDVFVSPVKEPHYLCHQWFPASFTGPGDEGFQANTVRDERQYQALFSAGEGYRVVGEASVYYLYFPDTAERIHALNPHAKIIVILRNPVDRAYSAYMHTVRDGRETLTFEQALMEEASRRRDGYQPLWWYREIGYYANQVKRYMDVFPPEQLRIFLYEDLQDASRVVQQCFEFLGISTDVEVDTEIRYNMSGRVRSRFWYNFFSQPNPVKECIKRVLPRNVSHRLGEKAKALTLRKDGMAPQTQEQLKADFRDDILRLQKLIGRDLSAWL
ncbi:hypothetical protein GCM10025857_01930 [Alicyclobacillus contaminans]|uniref:sulfotransferase family protein n=1 Tax=Alicyclobacillus contaminans TaxID=392016 RepID=UPI0003F9E537|nr:sulfotransferase [Alicyclobacillus contaminans]GMA48836.1 hypothetical protein GCM10025857_01930 [Alicyclobacillus contaminans]